MNKLLGVTLWVTEETNRSFTAMDKKKTQDTFPQVKTEMVIGAVKAACVLPK